jgi:putative phosphoesterase
MRIQSLSALRKRGSRGEVVVAMRLPRRDMRALVISDIHGNIDALRALELQWGPTFQGFDRLVCLGDLVDYGPDPKDVIEWVCARATDVVRGNHDHAMATGEPCRSTPAFLEASMLTRQRLRSTLTGDELAYLRNLPDRRTLTLGGVTWHLVHATPASPLHDYVAPDAANGQWISALGGLKGQNLLVGHTHLASGRSLAGGMIINPGSIGMPKDGHPHGSYAVIDDHAVQFRRITYDPEPMLQRLRTLDLPEHVFEQLARTFRTGS